MLYQNFKTTSSCVGGRQYFATISIESDISRTRHEILIGKYMQCSRNKSMIVSDNARAAESLGTFIKKLSKSSAKPSENLATNLMKNSMRALNVGAKIGSVSVSKSPITEKSTFPHVLKFYHTSKGYYFGKFIQVSRLINVY